MAAYNDNDNDALFIKKLIEFLPIKDIAYIILNYVPTKFTPDDIIAYYKSEGIKFAMMVPYIDDDWLTLDRELCCGFDCFNFVTKNSVNDVFNIVFRIKQDELGRANNAPYNTKLDIDWKYVMAEKLDFIFKITKDNLESVLIQLIQEFPFGSNNINENKLVATKTGFYNPLNLFKLAHIYNVFQEVLFMIHRLDAKYHYTISTQHYYDTSMYINIRIVSPVCELDYIIDFLIKNNTLFIKKN